MLSQFTVSVPPWKTPTHGPLSFVAFYDEAHVIVGALDNTVFAVVKREGGEVSCRVRLLSSEQPTGGGAVLAMRGFFLGGGGWEIISINH